MVPGNMDCLESFWEKGPGKMAPRAWHPELRTQDTREAGAPEKLVLLLAENVVKVGGEAVRMFTFMSLS